MIRDCHFNQYSVKPLVVARVPGIARIIGGFAELSRSPVFCAATEDSLSLALSFRDDNCVKVFNSNTGETKKFLLPNVKFRKEDHFVNAMKGVIKNLPVEKLPGLDITLCGSLLNACPEVCECSGAVALCLALNEVLNLKMGQREISGCVLMAISQFGVYKGSLATVLAILNAKPGYFMLIDKELRQIKNPFDCGEYAFIVIKSHIWQSAIGEEIDSIREAAENLLSKSQGRVNEDIIEDLIGDTRKLAKYLSVEGAVTLDAAKAIEKGDAVAFGRVLSRMGKSVSSDLRLGCPESDWLIKRSSEMTGSLGLSMIFTGSDGILAGVFRRDCLKAFESRISDYDHFFGLKASYHEFAPAGAASATKVD